MSIGGYYPTILVFMVIGALAGTVLGAIGGWLAHDVGWWGVGLLLGLLYGTVVGFARADRT